MLDSFYIQNNTKVEINNSYSLTISNITEIFINLFLYKLIIYNSNIKVINIPISCVQVVCSGNNIHELYVEHEFMYILNNKPIYRGCEYLCCNNNNIKGLEIKGFDEVVCDMKSVTKLNNVKCLTLYI